VYIVDSKEIVYRTYTDGGNLSAIWYLFMTTK
jgi:hypothetical protein